MYRRNNFIKWHNHALIRSSAHLISARKYELWHNIIGFTAIFAALIAGYKVIQPDQTDQVTLPWWTIVIGAFAIIAAVSNAALKFFGFEDNKQKHHTFATQYASLKYEIERWLAVPEDKIPEELFDKILSQLSELDKNAPLISGHIEEKVRNNLKEKELEEISNRSIYDVILTEEWKIENEQTIKIDNPIRTYKCDPFEICEYNKTGKITINGRHTMLRNKEEFTIDFKGEGIIDKNIGFFEYSERDINSGNTTYGTMVIPLSSRIKMKGYWITAGVVGAKILVGTIDMSISQKNSQERNPIQDEETNIN